MIKRVQELIALLNTKVKLSPEENARMLEIQDMMRERKILELKDLAKDISPKNAIKEAFDKHGIKPI